jgi:hypothetical protein
MNLLKWVVDHGLPCFCPWTKTEPTGAAMMTQLLLVKKCEPCGAATACFGIFNNESSDELTCFLAGPDARDLSSPI